MRPAIVCALAATLAAAPGCRDVSDFTTRPDEHFEGKVASGSFVRAGVESDAAMCLVLDTNRLQSGPGTLTTSDGRFRDAPLRPIPQLFHDPLSTLSFGDGRLQNLVYVVTATEADAGPSDVTAVVSLMQSGAVEVRVMRGAPGGEAASDPRAPPPLFGIFHLERREGACPH